jgi:hypothetical protein
LSRIVSQLKDLDCYQGRVNGSWGRPVQDALERFNTLAKLDLPVDEPQQATLDTLKRVEGPSLHDPGGRAPQGKGVEISSRETSGHL